MRKAEWSRLPTLIGPVQRCGIIDLGKEETSRGYRRV